MTMNRILFLLPGFAACGSDESSETGDPVVALDCESSGHVCAVVGVPETAAYAPEGLPADEATLYLVQDVTFGPDGTMYVLDFNNHRIRKVDADNLVWTVTGTGMLGDGPEGPAMAAAWNHPTGLAFHPNDPNTLYVAAWHNSRVNAIDLQTSTLDFYAGTGARSYMEDVSRDLAIFDLPSSVAFADDGTMYVTDQANQLVRKIGLDGIVSKVAGTKGVTGYDGDSGPAASALFHASVGQAADPSSRMVFQDGLLYLVDTDNNVVRVIDPAAGTITKVAGTYIENPVDGFPGDPLIDDKIAVGGYAGDGGPATAAQINGPRDLAFGIEGELYIADTNNSCIRVIDTSGIISTFAGTCDPTFACGDLVQGEYSGDGGPALDATFCKPYGVEVDAEGNVYVADTYNHVVRRINK
jgi:sugar lactone lactonase YvrE